MPFNGSGTFSIVNTFVPNTTILSAAVNQNFTDIATGLSDCLTRDGQAGMTAAFKAIAGSLAAPGISFTSDPTSGLYLSTAGVVGMVSHSLGMLLNTNVFSALSATIQAGGANYAVGDTITMIGGTAIIQPVFTVATLTGSAVASVTVTVPGFYTTKPTNPVSQGSTSGAGTGCTLNVTYNDPTSSVYRAVFTDQAGALLWQKFGASSFVSGVMASPTSQALQKLLLQAGTGLSISYATTPATINATIGPSLVPNYLSGLIGSTAGGSGTMAIAAGVANDTTNTTLMLLASVISKTTASWAVGSGNGGLDTGSIANSTFYHFYEIERTDTGVVDVIFSLSASAPALPTNYTLYRRIFSWPTDASAHWVAITQTGDRFIYSTSVKDVDNIAAVITRVNKVLTVPTGIVVNALFRGLMFNNGGSAAPAIIFTSLQESDQAPVFDKFADMCTNLADSAGGNFERLTDTSAQIGVRAAATGFVYSIYTYGWQDNRGRG